jgi:hypothetical protein
MEAQQETWNTDDIARAICRSYTGEINDDTLEVQVPESIQHVGMAAVGTCHAA